MLNTAIKRVTYYQASPVETCDRCGTGIKNVFLVSYQDATTQRYGSECINKILGGDTTLKGLFNRNAKKLQKYQQFLAILSSPESEMPRGSEYFNSGLYFIGNGEGKDVSTTHWFFHPEYDAEKNTAGGRYVVTDRAARLAECRKEIEQGKAWLGKEIARIEQFLAKVLRQAPKAAQ